MNFCSHLCACLQHSCSRTRLHVIIAMQLITTIILYHSGITCVNRFAYTFLALYKSKLKSL